MITRLLDGAEMTMTKIARAGANGMSDTDMTVTTEAGITKMTGADTIEITEDTREMIEADMIDVTVPTPAGMNVKIAAGAGTTADYKHRVNMKIDPRTKANPRSFLRVVAQ